MRRAERETWTRGASIYATALACFLFFIAACGPNQKILNSAVEPSPPAIAPNTPVTESETPTVEQDIQAMKNADFNFIHVFRRKDGGVLDEDDKKFLNAVTPAETNRRRLSDAGRAVIMGSNYRFPPEAMKALTDRFKMEDHSKPESELPGGNANSNK